MAKKTGSIELGTLLGMYELTRYIGSGGMGEVYEARHTKLNKAVALKLLRVDAEEHPEARARFLREGETASRIRHPNVVDITDFGEHEGTPYLVMELLRGDSLAAALKQDGPFSVERAVDVILPVVAAVGAAHEQGIVHRDLKPDNVFLSRDARGGVQAKVLDFGISKVLHGDDDVPDLTVTSSLLGTPYYMSPEQAQGAKHADERSDQYAVGVILYEMVCGKRPHERHAHSFIKLLHAIAQGNFELPRSLRPDLPLDFEDVMLRAMGVDPEKRYGSMTELGAALLPFASDRQHALWQQVFSGFTETLPSQPLPAGVAVSLADGGTLAGAESPRDPSLEATRMEVANPEAQAIPSSLPTSSSGELSLTPGGTIHSQYDRVPSRHRSWLIAGGVVVLAVAAGVMWQLLSPPSDDTAQLAAPSAPLSAAAGPAKLKVALTATPDDAVIQLDGKNIAVGKIDVTLDNDGEVHKLRVLRDGYEPQTVVFKDAPPPVSSITLEPRAGVTPPATNQAAEDLRDDGADDDTEADPKVTAGPRTGPAPVTPSPDDDPEEKPTPTKPRTDNIDPWAQ